jgi:hypothetical protein
MSPALAMTRALLAGEQAARYGQPLTVCPHRTDADTARERVLATMWLRGYARNSPLPVDFSG